MIVRRALAVVGTILAFTAINLVLCRDASVHFTGLPHDEDDTFAKAFGNRFYFSASVFSTAGFGDISPRSTLCRVVTLAMLFVVLFQVLDTLAGAPIGTP